ncbi:helix-turn-helix domain-containing protein [Actinoplanes rectilineatus]|uniref:helix-turn-helix domain-containing protein n=1 Tax=Actinoplanes rectilineatus TaxID=113571 RepID=UPI0009FADBF4|nr:helix-turn-helix transcriptional regulator [Actinoplanes rectilineatus]
MSSISSTDAPLGQEPVGVELARMRRARGLTGAVLAQMVGMSQPKISRLERGRGLPDPADVAQIARALGADERAVLGLMDRAEQQHDRITDWRPTSTSLASRQSTVADWESSVMVVRDFQPALLAGLLQTSGYAHAALLAFQRLSTTGIDESAETAVAAAVTARIRRQEILTDPAKSFAFVFTESALRNRICPPIGMLEQIEHLRRLAARPTVDIRVILDDASIEVPPLHGFTMLDDDLVIIDVYNTGLTSRGRNDVERYRQVFDLFQGSATGDLSPVLDKYRKLYIGQLG